MREEAGGGGGGGGGTQDTESKTRTPQKDVGKKNLTDYVIASVCMLELFPRWAKVTTTEIRCSGRFLPRKRQHAGATIKHAGK